MVTLTLKVERGASGSRLVFHHAEIDAADVQPMLVDLDHGTYVQAECEYVAGVGMRAVQVLAVTAHAQPSARTSIRALVEKREYDRALTELASLGELRISAEPTLMIARACARIGQGDEEGAASDLKQLLSVPGVTSLDVRDVFERFTERFGIEAAAPIAKDFVAWVEARKPVRAISYLSSVPYSMWPLELLLTGLEEAIEAAVPESTRVVQLLDAARSAAPTDPRVRSLWATAATKGLTARRPAEG